MHPTASFLLNSAFMLLVFLVVVGLLATLAFAAVRAGRDPRREVARGAWVIGALMGVGGLLAWFGVLQDFSLPPKTPLFVFTVLGLTTWLAVSSYGRFLAESVPLGALVGINAFRLPLEILMNHAHEEGVMPVQMSYSGQNYDVLTGILAIVVAVLVYQGKAGARGVRLFNLIGIVLLINILTIAILSMPLPIRVYLNEPANTWIAYFPFVWLPSVLVPTALLSHILLCRLASELSMGRSTSSDPPG